MYIFVHPICAQNRGNPSCGRSTAAPNGRAVATASALALTSRAAPPAGR